MRIDKHQVQALYRHHFPSFVRFAFREMHPEATLLEGWHIDLLADRLQACASGETPRLIANLPPRHLKSFCASVALPAWLLGRNPSLKILCITGSRALARSLEADALRLMRSPRYLALFPHMGHLVAGDGTSTRYGGLLRALSVGNPLIGLHADVMIIDDPMTPAQATKKKARKQQHRWFDENIVQRLNDRTHGAVIVVQQRLHIEDLSGYLLSKENHEWDHLCLPAIALQNEQFELRYHRNTVTRFAGEPLLAEFLSIRQLRSILVEVSGENFRAQYLQCPAEPRHASGYWCAHPEGAPYRPEFGFPPEEFFSISETQFLLREMFGENVAGLPERKAFCPSSDDWSALAELFRNKVGWEHELDPEIAKQYLPLHVPPEIAERAYLAHVKKTLQKLDSKGLVGPDEWAAWGDFKPVLSRTG